MPVKAYSYLRFSTFEQMKGDSLRRQTQLSEDYAKKNNLHLDESLTIRDLGVSAYRSKNVEYGKLKAFLDAVQGGRIEKGSYLLVESLDRISRDKVPIALELFLSILRQEIIIVTLCDGMRYEYSNLDTQQLIISIIYMSRAHNESEIKSERIGKAWEYKINNASNKPVTKWIPAWLVLSEGEIKVIPERAEIVQSMYDWVCEGLGSTLIVKRLEENGIEPWGFPVNIKTNGGSKKSRKPKRWYISYIQKILTNRAVLGEYCPRKSSSQLSNAVKNYFPQIVDEEKFYRVQQIRKSRNVSKGIGIGRRGDYVSNLFSGLLKCGYSQDNNLSGYRCAGNESSITIYGKGRKSNVRYLQCSKIRDGGAGCESCRKLWRYDSFESIFLNYAKEISIELLLGDETLDRKKEIYLKNDISKLSGKLDHLNKEVQKIISSFGQEQALPRFLVTHSHQIQQDIEDIEKEIKTKKEILKNIQNHNKNRDGDFKKFKEVLNLLQKQNNQESLDIRLKFSEMLRQSIERIDVYVKGRIFTDRIADTLLDVYSDKKTEASQFINLMKDNYQPFFVIFYKTGEKRVIMADKENPDKLYVTAKWTGDSTKVMEVRLDGLKVSILD